MNTWFRKVGMGAVALTLAGVIGGCNNGGGSGLLTLFFGINGTGNCNSVTVDVDLAAAGAVIALDDAKLLQCSIKQGLANAGCALTFPDPESHPGHLYAVIGDIPGDGKTCSIPAVTNLFSCVFTDVNLSELKQTAEAICACKAPIEGCDGTPPVCIGQDPNPTSCEICNNGKDDDGNGLTDCNDPNCENSQVCQDTTTTAPAGSSSTSLQTASSSSSSSSLPETTTTLPPAHVCKVTFEVKDTVLLGNLQWDTDYSNVPGFKFPGTAQEGCASLINGSTGSFLDKPLQQVFTSGILKAPPGFQAPALVSECQFEADLCQLSDFADAITLVAADAPTVPPTTADPVPTVTVKSVVYMDDTTTTLPPVTTTTLPPNTTTTEPINTTTTLPGVPVCYVVTYRATSASAKFFSAQYTSNYGTATGLFQIDNTLEPAGPDCAGIPGSTIVVAQDDIPNRILTTTFVAANGVTVGAGKDLVKCHFMGNAVNVPTPANFPPLVLNAKDASDVDVTLALITSTVVVDADAACTFFSQQ